MSDETRVLTRDPGRALGEPLTPSKRLEAVDLFSGTGSATRIFRQRGHYVFTVELDEKFDADLHADVRELTPLDLMEPFRWRRPDFIWASIPCTSYSTGSFRHHWRTWSYCLNCLDGEVDRVSGEKWDCSNCDEPRPDEHNLHREPKSETGELGLELLRATLRLIEALQPRWWIIENPVAMMRKMPELEGVDRRTITHCSYGDPRRMKPTDLFGVFPEGFEARTCDADRYDVVEVDGIEYRPLPDGSPCHQAASRGAKTGTQGLDKTESAMLPPDLGLELCLAMEDEL